MWVPKSEADIVARAATGDLTETAIFEAKRELPPPGKSIDLAIDVAALANEGGVLLYGLGEDERKRLTVLAPIPLDGIPERIDSIVRSSIAEPPTIEIEAIPAAADPTIGYVAVVVPPSPRAPHMVVKDKDHRYYGRSATGNVRLTEGEVARLYARRQRWEADRAVIIDQEIARSPLPPHADFAYLYIGARPVVPDDQLLERLRQGHLQPSRDARLALAHLVYPTAADAIVQRNFSPDMQAGMGWQIVADGFRVTQGYDAESDQWRQPDAVLTYQVDHDGCAHLFCGRAGQRTDDAFYVWEVIVAGLTTRLLHLMGGIYQRAGYLGPVDVGVAVTNLKGAISHYWRFGRERPFLINRLDAPPRYDRDEYRRTARFLAAALAEDPVGTARALTEPLYRVTTAGMYDPFEVGR